MVSLGNTLLRLFLLGGILIGGAYLLMGQVPCKRVLEYSLGEVDARFGIGQEDLLANLAKSEEAWERYAGRELFRYQEGATFKVNLIYDQRQERTDALAGLEDTGEFIYEEQGKISGQYEKLKANYEAVSRAYEQHVVSYTERLETYNQKVSMWNKRGGAPENEYQELADEKKALDEEGESLERERQNVNALVVRINGLAEKEEEIIQEYNTTLKDYQERYGPAQEFDQGEYVGQEINIYQFHDAEELRLVLAHEFGHALGIEHVENPESLMYYLMEKQSAESIRLTTEDKSAFDSFCAHAVSWQPESVTESVRFLLERVRQMKQSYAEAV